MPIEYTPPRRLIEAYIRLRKRLRGESPEANQIKAETIEAVNDDGTYVVKARSIGATGNIKLAAGQKVDVVWKNGRPHVIMAHNARRAHFNIDGGQPGFPVIEELFLPDFGDDRRVWFRNGSDFKPILFTKSTGSLRNIGGVQVNVDEVYWGRFSPDHFVILGTRDSDTFPVIAVYRLNRPTSGEPFPPGFRIAPTLVQIYVLPDAAGPSFGTLSVSNGAGSASSPLRAFSGAGVSGSVIFGGPSGPTAATVTTSAICQARYQGVAPNGDLILRLNVTTNTTIVGPDVGQATFVGANVGTLLVNMKRGTVLASHAPDRVQGLFVRLQNSITPPDPLTFACFSVTGGATVSTGHNLDSGTRGDAYAVSVKMVGPVDAQVPALNNYALIERDDQTGTGTSGGAHADPSVCYPGSGDFGSASVFRIIGEFAQVIANLPGGTVASARRATFQASRTHVFWAIIANLDYLPSPILNLIDLTKSINAEIGTQPALVLLTPASLGIQIPQFPLRQMIATRSGLIFAPQGPSTKTPPDPPYNVQFFVSGGVEPPLIINQADLQKNDGLEKVASFKKVILPDEALIVQSEDGDVQTLNSASLGSFKTASSL